MTPRLTLGAAFCVLAASLIIGASGRAASGAPRGAAAPCRDPLPARATASVGELITVVAPAFTGARASLTLYRREGVCFVRAAGPYPAWLGARGLSLHHVEGDRTTPAGLFRIGPTMYGASPDPGLAFPYRHLSCGDWWDEDAASPKYNRFVALSCGATPAFGGESEALWRTLPAYDYLAVIDYNTSPAVPGRGSGIFLHVSTGQPTVGCVSLATGALLEVLRSLAPAEKPAIAIGTVASLGRITGIQNL